jgi:uncharacterized membrane protein
MLFPAWVESAFLFVAFFVIVPAVAIVIGHTAWMGKPKNWDRSTYWTAFIVFIVASGFLMLYAQWMQADVRTWRYAVQMALFGLGVLLFGVAGGCGVGIFTYGRGVGPIFRQREDSTDNAENDHPSDH